MLINLVSSDKQLGAYGEVDPDVMSRRCWARSLDPPGLDPRGNLFRAKVTPHELTVIEGEMV